MRAPPAHIWGSRALFWFTISYAALLLLLAPRLTLWLDEILTLTGAVQPDLASLMENLRKQQGASPLAFLIPHWIITIAGLSNFTARLASVIPAIASLPAVYWLARRAGLAQPMLAVAVFALWPLEFRYALEARPYALALCLGLWLTVALLAEASALLYILITLAMALVHPYSLFIPIAHAVWARTRTAVIALAIAGIALMPWYLHFRDDWRIVSAEQELSAANWRAPLIFLREISGSGYIGAAILAAGIFLGLMRRTHSSILWPRNLWIALALVPLIAAPIANVAFDYFFAIRQVIYALPALAILLAKGNRYLVAAFLVASIYADVRWFTKPREDWSAAANAALAEVRKDACITFVADSQKLYAFFVPELANHACSTDATRVVLAGSTYETETHQAAARALLTSRGLSKQSEKSFLGPFVEVYQ